MKLTDKANSLNRKTAISYIRWSSGKQKLGDSLRRQLERTEEYCARYGYSLDTRIVDDGVSGYKGANLKVGKLGAFLEQLRKDKGRTIKRGTVLILENLDRLTRQNILDAQRLFLEILSYGIDIVTLQDGQHYSEDELKDNPAPLYVSLGAMIRANQESVVKGDRVKKARFARNQKGRAGEKFRVWCPRWCEFNDGKYVVDEAKAMVIRRIFKDYLAGLGMVTIAKRLNRDGVPTFSPRSKEWYKKYILDTLKDRKVVGYAHWLEKEDYFPSVVSKDVFNAAQLRLTERFKKRGPVGKNVGNLFTGICRCPKCGYVMVKNINSSKPGGGDYSYIVCMNARRGMKCEYKSITYPAVESSFIQLLDSPEFYSAMHETEEMENRVSKLDSFKGELVATQKRIEKINNMIMDEDNPPKSLLSKLKGLELREEELSKAIKLETTSVEVFKELPAEAYELKNQMHTKLKEPDFRLKLRELIRSLVAKIEINTLDTYQNYQVFWKNGNVSSVVLAPATFSDRTKGHVFGVFKGVVRKPKDITELCFSSEAA